MKNIAPALLPLVVAWVALSCGSPHEPADLVLLDGRIATVDPAIGDVEALAVVDGRVAAAGPSDDIRSWIGRSTRVVKLDGRRAIPGFIEGHGHLYGLGRFRRDLDLFGTANWEEVVALVAEVAAGAEPGVWIEGRGWHQDKWDRAPDPAVDGYPVHDALSAVSPDNPVYLNHASGHVAMVNAAALRAAGIDADTPDPAGGVIGRHASGRPTGILHENAEVRVQDALQASLPAPGSPAWNADTRAVVELAVREALAHGVTSFQDAGSTFEQIDVLRAMADEGALGIRVWAMLSDTNDDLAERLDSYRIQDAGDGHLTVRAIKAYADGALGNRGAWLLEPYNDDPSGSGINVTALEDLRSTAELAAAHGFQLCTHAIGDRGAREILDIYESTMPGRGYGDGPRWRVEHAQQLSPEDIPRFAGLGVVASMQGVHCTSDGPWVPDRVGEARARDGAYVWRALLDSGAVVSNGTDVPVEPIDPIAGFHALVSRRMNNGERFHPEQAMTRDEALEAMTRSAAFAAFEDDRKGTLAPGMLADIAVLSHDILSVDEAEIPGTEIDLTIVGGEVRYERSP